MEHNCARNINQVLTNNSVR